MRTLLKNMIRPLYYYIKNKNEREFYRLFDKYGRVERYKRIDNIKFLKYEIDIIDFASFIWQFKEIFVDEIYKFETNSNIPVIYDCGANIGISCLYFKNLYPNAKIKAFEADPVIVNILKTNLVKNNINDVEIIDKAVWIDDKGVEFGIEGADGGSIYLNNMNKVKIESVRLKDLLEKEERVDLLKMDIEGAEYEVLKDCYETLDKIKYIFVEYHSWNNTTQKLSEILAILEQKNFRYYIENISKKKAPFVNNLSKADSKMDLQLNIWAIKHEGRG